MDTSPHTSGFVSGLGGVRLHYLDWGGSGPALVFLTGLGSNPHIFDGFAPRFTKAFRVLALTRRGHGESDTPETGYDIDTLAEDIRLFLDSLGIERAVLVQNSNEGIDLPRFAARFPGQVEKLVFLEPAWDRTSTGFQSMMDAWKKIDEDVIYPEEPFDTIEEAAAIQTRNYPANAASWCEARQEELRHTMVKGPDGKAAYKSNTGILQARETMFSYSPEFSAISAPVLAIFPIRGESYYVLPFMTPGQKARMLELYRTHQLPWFRHTIEQFRRAVPHARVVELENSHTYFFITQADAVYQEMIDFLTAN